MEECKPNSEKLTPATTDGDVSGTQTKSVPFRSCLVTGSIRMSPFRAVQCSSGTGVKVGKRADWILGRDWNGMFKLELLVFYTMRKKQQ